MCHGKTTQQDFAATSLPKSSLRRAYAYISLEKGGAWDFESSQATQAY